MQTPRTEFAQALRAIATERNLDAEVIMDTIKQAIVAAFKRDARERGEDYEEWEFEVEMDPTSGEAKLFAWPADKPEEKKDVTPPGFGRIAAQTAKQVIHQKIREAEKGAIMGEFEGRVGSLISGMILRFDGPDVRVDLGRTEGLMPASERVPNERLNPNQRLTFLMKAINETLKGKQILLSRADPSFVSKLFEREVPEISSGSVEVKGISREAGLRTKIAVFSNQSGVDPVGSCVGQKGVRVQAVTNELGGERVDIIPWSNDTAEMIKAALAPAEDLAVSLNEKEKIATVKAPEDQLSLAIGKDGQNARLAAKLTGWKIEIKELDGAKKEKKEQAEPAQEKQAKADKPVDETEKVEKKDAATKDVPASDNQQKVSDDSGDSNPDEKQAEEETKIKEEKEEVENSK
ncbi:transcription termination factor NusA [Candidatus Woesebacteria bacterium GWA1_41_8]|uniref:Transcription termination/antitermination protein NusA n=1 Tax=Candidatus Woesebacteria bacterium GWA1_41_8 TaxID=1802471 RepID=A0A1F7WJT2_9BACT|nr:MAG: transcription termination factor NusA [Candidatus Woesebacteria bacterium GWA1_41_8]